MLTGTCALTNLLSAGAGFARAGESPGEARGWRLLGGSVNGDGGTVSVPNGPKGGCLFLITYPMAS
jgi:hypothetical protein